MDNGPHAALYLVADLAELPNLLHERLARAYMTTGGKVPEAAAVVGYHPKYAWRLIARPDIAARIKELREDEAKSFELGRDDIMARWTTVATADPRKLIQHRIGSCRYCWGEGHAYQWKSEREHRIAWLEWLEGAKTRALATDDGPLKLRLNEDPEGYAAEANDPRIPSLAGGTGYVLNRDPCASCPDCGGMGVPYVQAADTSKLTPAEAAIFAGVKVTNNGIELQFRDQAKPLENVARERGMLKAGSGDDPEPAAASITRLLDTIAERAAALPNRTARPKPGGAEK